MLHRGGEGGGAAGDRGRHGTAGTALQLLLAGAQQQQQQVLQQDGGSRPCTGPHRHAVVSNLQPDGHPGRCDSSAHHGGSAAVPSRLSIRLAQVLIAAEQLQWQHRAAQQGRGIHRWIGLSCM